MEFTWSHEQKAIHKEIKDFAKKELNQDLYERDQKCIFNVDGWKKCADIGIQGLAIPKEYGGSECDALTTAYAMEGLGSGCFDNGLTHAINSHMWGCEIPISKFGNKDQKKAYLNDLCRGTSIGGHAITEPDAGSDVFSIKTTAIKENNYYIINGSKSIVSNGPIADIIILFAVTDEKKGFLGGFSAFIIETNTKGVTIGEPLRTMGLNTGPISEIFFDGCKIHENNLLGSKGLAIRIFNETMEWERSCLFACHLGAIERLLKRCIDHAKNRIQFGKPISNFQAIANKIVKMKMNLELGRSAIYKVAWLKSINKNVLLESAIAKLFISESLKKCAEDAVQIFGAYGYLSEHGIEKEFRDSIAATIYSGTSEIQKNIISKSLGL